MNVGELITLFRRQSEESTYTHDSDMPSSASLWSNYQLIHYINQAQYEFAEKTLYFKDGVSFVLDVTAEEPEINLDERILKIERAELVTAKRILSLKTIEEFETSTKDEDYSIVRSNSWLTRTGTPSTLITDINSSTARLYPIPIEDDTLNLTVRRYPLYVLENLTDELEVPKRWQYGLLYKVQEQAYSVPQALVLGYEKAMLSSAQQWEKFILEASSTIKKKTRGPGRTRYGGL